MSQIVQKVTLIFTFITIFHFFEDLFTDIHNFYFFLLIDSFLFSKLKWLFFEANKLNEQKTIFFFLFSTIKKVNEKLPAISNYNFLIVLVYLHQTQIDGKENICFYFDPNKLIVEKEIENIESHFSIFYFD